MKLRTSTPMPPAMERDIALMVVAALVRRLGGNVTLTHRELFETADHNVSILPSSPMGDANYTIKVSDADQSSDAPA